MKHCDKIPLFVFIWFCLLICGLLVAKGDYVCLGNHSVGGNSCITGIGKGVTAQQAKQGLVGDVGQEIPTVTWRCAGGHVAFTGAFLGRYRWTSTDATGRQYTAYYCSRCDFGISSTPYIITKNLVAYPLNAVIPDWASTSPYFNVDHGSPVFDDFGGVTGISGATLVPPVNPSTGLPSVAGTDGDWTFAQDGEPSWNSYRTSAGAVNLDAPVVAPSDGLNNDYIKQMGDKLDNSLDAIRTKLDAQINFWDGINARSIALGTSLDSLGSGVGGLQSSVGGLSSSMSDLQSAVGSMGSGIGGLYGMVNDVYSGVNNVGASVGGLQAGLDAVTSASSGNSAKIDALSSQIGTVDYKLDDVGNKIDSLSAKVDGLSSSGSGDLSTLESGQSQLIDIGDGIKVSLDTHSENFQNFATAENDRQTERQSWWAKLDDWLSKIYSKLSQPATNDVHITSTNIVYGSTNIINVASTNNINFSSTNIVNVVWSNDVDGALGDSENALYEAKETFFNESMEAIAGLYDDLTEYFDNMGSSLHLMFSAYENIGRMQPDFTFEIDTPFGKVTTPEVPSSWWDMVSFMRGLECVGLVVGLVLKITSLLSRVFGSLSLK